MRRPLAFEDVGADRNESRDTTSVKAPASRQTDSLSELEKESQPVVAHQDRRLK